MKTNFLKKLFSASLLFSIIFVPMVLISLPANAQVDPWGENDENLIQNGNPDYMDDSTLGSKDPRAIAATVIKVMLGFLGIIAVIIIMLGGFKWMTAAGNDDQVGEARNLMGAGAVGLLIILASYGLAVFVLNSLISATS